MSMIVAPFTAYLLKSIPSFDDTKFIKLAFSYLCPATMLSPKAYNFLSFNCSFILESFTVILKLSTYCIFESHQLQIFIFDRFTASVGTLSFCAKTSPSFFKLPAYGLCCKISMNAECVCLVITHFTADHEGSDAEAAFESSTESPVVDVLSSLLDGAEQTAKVIFHMNP